MKKVAICTGANGGLGIHFCREMLSRDFHVTMACRSKPSGEQVLKELQQEFPNASVELMIVDMGDLSSIETFANEFSSKHSQLDVLAHNAGVYSFDKERRTTADAIEWNFGIHFVGPFALTARLFPLLKATPGARVVCMSSKEHENHPVDLDDIQMTHDFASLGNSTAYARSKFATLQFADQLHRRFQASGLDLHSTAAHPGVSITGIQHNGNPTVIQKGAIWLFGKLLAAPPEEAAKPLVMASTIGTSGEFFGPTGFKEMKGPAGRVKPDPGTKDPTSGEVLWKTAENLSGLTIST